MTLEQATKLVIKVLSKTMDSTTLSPEKVEISTLTSDGDKVTFKIFEDMELKPILDAANEEQIKEKENAS